MSPTNSARAAVAPSAWAGFAMMCVGMFMAILDVQVVATSLPTIQSALGIEPDQMSWVQTAYLIAEVVAIPLTGFLTRCLTMRLLFVASVMIFTAASIGCAGSGSFASLIAWRVLQGLSGGTLIPAVFSAVFLLFPMRLQGIAATIAGVLAVLAPTVGPIVGGWITETYSWHWLFLINVVPGLVSGLAGASLLPAETPKPREWATLDVLALVSLAVALATLEIGLKQAPHDGWLSVPILACLAVAVASAATFARRTLAAAHPLLELRTLADRSFALGCVLSFVLGTGLFGSVYMMPVFLAYVRGHGSLEIGEIMLVTGVAQLATAPVAAWLDRRLDSRLLTAAGFFLYAIGLGLSAVQTAETDFAAMFWPQVVRGVAIMFCLLPPTRIALGQLAPAQVADASGLFNLMRNLGGAIGLALVDTIIYGRTPINAQAITDRLQAGDADTAMAVGIPLASFAARPAGPLDPATQALIAPLIERLAFVQAVNQAWAAVALLTLGAVGCVPLIRYVSRTPARVDEPRGEPAIASLEGHADIAGG